MDSANEPAATGVSTMHSGGDGNLPLPLARRLQYIKIEARQPYRPSEPVGGNRRSR